MRSFFNRLFRRGADKSADTIRQSQHDELSDSDGEYTGDLTKTAIVHNLCQVPHHERDEQWAERMLKTIADASFCCDEPDKISRGPDGFPYLRLRLPRSGEAFQCFVIRAIKEHLLREGIGVVIGSAVDQPDFVLSYGDIVSLHVAGTFFKKTAEQLPKGMTTLTPGTTFLLGSPSEEYLPSDVRDVIKRYVGALGLPQHDFMLTCMSPESPHPELTINFEPHRFANSQELNAVMGRISWFLPRHYSLVAMPVSIGPEDQN